MDVSYNKAEFKTALKIGLICGIVVALIELYYLLVGLASTVISQPIYQTLWLLTAFIIALAGIWAARMAKNIYDAALYAGATGAVAGILYIIAINVVQFISLLYQNLRYYFNISTFLGDFFGVALSSVLVLPVVIAVAVFGGVAYVLLTRRTG